MASSRPPLNTPLTVLAPQDGLIGQMQHFTSGGSDSFHVTVRHRESDFHVIITPDRSTVHTKRQEASRLYFDDAEIVVVGTRSNHSFHGNGFVSSNATVPDAPTGKLTLTTALEI